jgi:hypothetical protein
MRVKTLCRHLLHSEQYEQLLFFLKKKFTLNARSFAVKIPLRPSSSSTTSTQSVLFAAQSWLASETVRLSGTVRAGLGLSAATVPLPALGCA